MCLWFYSKTITNRSQKSQGKTSTFFCYFEYYNYLPAVSVFYLAYFYHRQYKF